MLNGGDVTTIHVINIHNRDTCMVQYTAAGCDHHGDRADFHSAPGTVLGPLLRFNKRIYREEGRNLEDMGEGEGMMRWGRQYIEPKRK